MKLLNNIEKNSLKESMKVIFRMWKFADPWKVRFYFGFLFGCTMPLFFSFYSSYTVKKFTELCTTGDMKKMISVLINIGIIALFGVIIYPICFGIVYTTYSRIGGSIQKKIFIHAQNLPVSYIESRYSGDIVSRVTGDYNDAIQLVAYPTVGQNNPFAKTFTIIATAVIVFLSNCYLGLLSIALGMLSIYITTKFSKTIKAAEIRTKEICGKASQSIINTLSGTMTSRIFNLDDYLKNTYEKNTEDIYENNMKLIKKKSLMGAVNQFEGFLSFTGIMAAGLVMSAYNLIDIPTVIFIASMQMNMAEDFRQLGQEFAGLQKYIAGAERLFEFFDAEEEDDRKTTVRPDYNKKEAVSIKNLCFKYKDSDREIFNNFNLEIENGKSLAIVGGSGGGKSTLFKLLLGFSEYDSGEINMFGNDSKLYSLKDLRGMFSYVPQDSYLFDATIEENIAWGNPEASFDEIEKAAKAAYLGDYINSLPDGYKTRVGERGAQISGGQRQRIAIARAFLKNSPIILLDEATSALDSESEREVQKAIEDLMKNRTSVIIAHRLSTIQNADRIIVIENGKKIEDGTHNDLIDKKGRYFELYNMQYTEDN